MAEIEVKGLDKLIIKIDGMCSNTEIFNCMEKACLVVEESARKKAPKDTGNLKRSIASKVENNGVDITGTVYTPVEYAPYLEYGTGLFAEEGGRKDVPWSYQDDKGEWHSTKGMKPQPYMRPALKENVRKIKKIFREGIIKDD